MLASDDPATDAPSDNPCWGGPEEERHSLEYLLRFLATPPRSRGAPEPINFDDYQSFLRRVKDRLILYDDDDIVVINKPADLRIDGPFSASVHKLMLYLYPSPTLQSQLDEKLRDADFGSVYNKRRHTALLHLIAPLATHAQMKDDPIRLVHQLDYATSGVLLMAKSKKAAASANRAFADRLTDKQYVAVVSNLSSEDVPIGPEFVVKLPSLPSSSLEPWRDGTLENRYRKKRSRDASGTFDGYMPIHTVFAKFRSKLLRCKNTGSEAAKQNKKRKASDDLPSLPESSIPISPGEVDELLELGQSWKKVRSSSNGSKWISILEPMTKEYNRALLSYYEKKREQERVGDVVEESKSTRNQQLGLPPLFRLSDDGSQEELDSFYICAAIGDYEDNRFRVVVDPGTAASSVHRVDDQSALPEMRPSLTKCTVLWRGHTDRGSDDGRVAVSKVLLKPWTGRRHQLRVHLAHVVGFSILGDKAYEGNGNQKGRAITKRMCLHAKQLDIPLKGKGTMRFEAPEPLWFD